MSLQEEKLLLLKTIKVPRNLGQINAGLPKANYEPGEHKVEEKRLRTRNQSLPPTKDAMSQPARQIPRENYHVMPGSARPQSRIKPAPK